MPEELSSTSATDSLLQLEQLLAEETQALVRLDAGAVQKIAQQKLHLCEALAKQRATLTGLDSVRLSVLRQRLRDNLVLLSHAREQVKNTVNGLTGRPSTLGPLEPQHCSSRLSLRG